MKKLIGWTAIILLAISVIIITGMALLQAMALITIWRGEYPGVVLGAVVKNFPIGKTNYMVIYSLCGCVFLTKFHKWQFPENYLSQSPQNRFR